MPKSKCQGPLAEVTAGETFDFGGMPLRIFWLGAEIWFAAREVRDALEYQSASDSTDWLDEDERALARIPSAGGDQAQVIISESGLYHLVLRSKKPQAKHFRRWITTEVLPSIRKTGSYERLHGSFNREGEVAATGQRMSDAERQLVHAVRQPGRYVAFKELGRDVWFEPQPYETVVSDMAETDLRGLAAAAHLTLALWEGNRRLDGIFDQGALSEGFGARLDNAIRLNANLADTLMVWRRK